MAARLHIATENRHPDVIVNDVFEATVEDKLIGPGGEITTTQDAINIADLLGRFVFGSTQKQGEEKPKAGGDSGATQPAQ